MINWFKRMSPEEAAAFRRAGSKFMALPFAAIVLVGTATAISPDVRDFLGFSNYQQPASRIVLRPATIGEQFSYNFAEELIPLLGPRDNPPIYNFYLGTMNGFVPLGLVLWPDGTLKGIPTGKGTEFQVCVKDSAGKSACKEYRLNVQPKATATATKSGLPQCRDSCMHKTSLGSGYGPSFDYCCPNQGDPLIGAPNISWKAGDNGVGSNAGKTDAAGHMYWLLSDGQYHLQVYCPCKEK